METKVVGAVIEFVLATILFGFTGTKALERNWKWTVIAATCGVVILLLGLDLLWG